MATPTIEKEFFFEHNRVQKINIIVNSFRNLSFLFFEDQAVIEGPTLGSLKSKSSPRCDFCVHNNCI